MLDLIQAFLLFLLKMQYFLLLNQILIDFNAFLV